MLPLIGPAIHGLSTLYENGARRSF